MRLENPAKIIYNYSQELIKIPEKLQKVLRTSLIIIQKIGLFLKQYVEWGYAALLRRKKDISEIPATNRESPPSFTRDSLLIKKDGKSSAQNVQSCSNPDSRNQISVSSIKYVNPPSKTPREYLLFDTNWCEPLECDRNGTAVQELLGLLQSTPFHNFHITTEENRILFHHNWREIAGSVQDIPGIEDYIVDHCSDNCFTNQHISKKGVFWKIGTKSGSSKLIQEAQNYAAKKTYRPVVPFSWSQEDGSILEKVYREFDGLCIGERQHCDVSSKKLIIDNIEKLKACGVTTLFLEHLFYDTIQEDLDAYFTSENDEPMPFLLRCNLRYIDNMFMSSNITKNPFFNPYSFTELVRIAKKAQIRVVAIDTSISYECGVTSDYSAKGVDRYTAMNYVATKIMQHEKQGGKYIALMGVGHGSSVPSEGNYPGVSEFMQCPFIVVQDVKENPGIETHVTSFRNKKLFIHAVLSLVP